MNGNGLICIILTVLSVVLGVGGNFTQVEVREGLTDYLIQCFDHGSESNPQQRIFWLRSDFELTSSDLPQNDADNLTLVASWDGQSVISADSSAWTLDDYGPGGVFSLRIYNTSFPRDNGYLYCVDQDSKTVLKRYHLLVLVRIEGARIVDPNGNGGIQSVVLTEGQETQLSCSVTRANPPPWFIWTVDHEEFPNASYPLSESAYSGLVSFTPTKDMNGAIVRCLVGNGFGPAKVTEATINALYYPRLTIDWKSGTNVLTCEADGNPAEYQFQQWEHWVGDTLVETLDSPSFGSSTVLHLPDSGYQSTGNYACVVSNSVGLSKNSSLYLQPASVPVFETRSRSLLASEGGRVDISVGFYSNPVFTRLVWEKAETDYTAKLNSHTVKPAFPSLDFNGVSVHLPGNLTMLSLKDVKVEDAGIYTVIVTNSEGVSSYSITLTVHPIENRVTTQPTTTVRAEVKVESQPLARQDNDVTAARQGSPDEEVDPVSVPLAVALSCISVIIIIVVIAGVCLVRHGKIPLHGRRKPNSDSHMTESQSTIVEDLSFENTSVTHPVDKELPIKGILTRRVSFKSPEVEEDLDDESETSSTEENEKDYPVPRGILLTDTAYLPAGSLQSMV